MYRGLRDQALAINPRGDCPVASGPTDAQAMFGLSHQAGLTKVRHIEAVGLRIQDALQRREFVLVQVGCEYVYPFGYTHQAGAAGHRRATLGDAGMHGCAADSLP